MAYSTSPCSVPGIECFHAVDRAAYEQILEVAPRQGEVSRMNRRWLHRVVRFLAGPAGIDQFLDIGAGLPTVGNTHEVAQRQNPEARVVYVDCDPLCAVHGRVMLERDDYTWFVHADLCDEGTLLTDPQVGRLIETDRPLGLLVVGLLHHLGDDVDPAAVMRSYVDLLPEGSYVAISHFWDPGEEDLSLHGLARALEERFVRRGLGSGWYRTRAQIASCFGGLPLVEPGLVELDDRWPEGPPPRPRYPEERLMLGGLAYKRPAWNRAATGGTLPGPVLAGPSGRPATVSCGRDAGGEGAPWSGGGPAVRGR
ncbi:SAM-dependent methyltransferase [Nocardia brevicatena]|uniref:SAM-dependent methyltransferase n=1 Tax=Nocardia brevicatena TaxID=37327 RepID=UPI0006864D81|nr:SAM-dependent methyltransferase [Nocardia brevicatena]